MMYTDDIDKHTAKLEKDLENTPICQECGEHIQDECYHEIPFYGAVCNDCLRDWKKWRD